MQRGVKLWEAAGYLGMTEAVVNDIYGHHPRSPERGEERIWNCGRRWTASRERKMNWMHLGTCNFVEFHHIRWECAASEAVIAVACIPHRQELRSAMVAVHGSGWAVSQCAELFPFSLQVHCCLPELPWRGSRSLMLRPCGPSYSSAR